MGDYGNIWCAMQETNSNRKGDEARLSRETIRNACLFVALVASFVSVVDFKLFWSASAYGDMVLKAALMIAFIGWMGVVLSQRMSARNVAAALIIAVQMVSIYSIFTFGSIRGAGTVLFFSTVAAAGIFLSGRALAVTLLASIAAMGAVTYAEWMGEIVAKSLQVNILTWFIYSVVLAAVAMLVFYGRERMRVAYEKQISAMEEIKVLVDARDRGLQRFARIFRNSPDPMLALSEREGIILDANPAFERCFGYKREDVLGRTDHFLWARKRHRKSYVHRLVKERLVAQYSGLGLRANGSQFDALISGEMSDDAEDNLVITTVIDNSVQAEALAKLRRSEERFSKAFRFNPLHMTITRFADGQLMYANDFAKRGLTAGIQGRGAIAKRFFPTPEHQADFARTLRRQGNLCGYETQLLAVDGTLVDVRIYAEQIEMDGEPCVLTCTLNVTEERRRQTLLENLDKGLSEGPGESFFLTLVKHMCEALSAETVFVAEIDSLRQLRTLAMWRNGMAAPEFTEQLTSLPEQPSEVPLGADIQEYSRVDWPLLAIDGQTIGVLSVQWKTAQAVNSELRALMSIFASRANAELLRHVQEHEVKRLNLNLEDRVRIRTAELSKLNAELDSFAYSISHDLKSPLRAIDGFTHLLSERLHDRLDEEDQRLMQRVLAATRRTSTLMADLLALTRVSQAPLRKERLNLSMMAEEELERCLSTSPRPALRWKIELGLFACADAELTRVVLKNLISNAVKFTRDQSTPLIEIGRMPHPENAEEAPAVFIIRDNGAGFSMQYADMLFKPFQHLHMPSAGFEGSGIGLATVRRIIERHGGSIEGEGSEGQGAVFRFSLEDGNAKPSSDETL